VEGRSSLKRLIQDITPLSTAYFADGRPTEFLVGTRAPLVGEPPRVRFDYWLPFIAELNRTSNCWYIGFRQLSAPNKNSFARFSSQAVLKNKS
jgi:hypothetical protein